MIQAIETHYNGYRFRSRLEARWAVFFDALNIRYEYESQGFHLSDGTLYLPDFYLPSLSMYVEIKGDSPTTSEQRKVQLLAHDKGMACIVARSLGDERIWIFSGREEPKRWKDDERQSFWSGILLRKNSQIITAYNRARSARFEYGETPQVIERVEYKTIEQSPLIWRDVDIIVRDYGPYADFTKRSSDIFPMKGIHLNDGGVPLCKPLDPSNNGGFNLGKWQARRADVLVSNICKRCISYSLARAKRARKNKA